MNKYFILLFVAWSGFMFFGGIKYEGYRAGEKDAQTQVAEQQGTIKAQTGVIAKQQKAAIINQKGSKAYEDNAAIINGEYDNNGVYDTAVATGSGVQPVAPSAARVGTGCPVQTSKKYKLTPKQCDLEEAKLLAVWDLYTAQGQNQSGAQP